MIEGLLRLSEYMKGGHYWDIILVIFILSCLIGFIAMSFWSMALGIFYRQRMDFIKNYMTTQQEPTPEEKK